MHCDDDFHKCGRFLPSPTTDVHRLFTAGTAAVPIIPPTCAYPKSCQGLDRKNRCRLFRRHAQVLGLSGHDAVSALLARALRVRGSWSAILPKSGRSPLGFGSSERVGMPIAASVRATRDLGSIDVLKTESSSAQAQTSCCGLICPGRSSSRGNGPSAERKPPFLRPVLSQVAPSRDRQAKPDSDLER